MSLRSIFIETPETQVNLAATLADVRLRSEFLHRRSFTRFAPQGVPAPAPSQPVAALGVPNKEKRLVMLKEAAQRAEEKLEKIRAEMEETAK
jgi:hypothetical protein